MDNRFAWRYIRAHSTSYRIVFTMLDPWAQAAYRKAKSKAGDLADRTNRPVTFWLDEGSAVRFDDPPPKAATETIYPRLGSVRPRVSA